MDIFLIVFAGLLIFIGLLCCLLGGIASVLRTSGGGCLYSAGGAMLILIGIVVMSIAGGSQVNQHIAVTSSAKVSTDLSGEVETSQHVTDSEANRIKALSDAEYQNRLGYAAVTKAEAQANLYNAQANKTDAEARTIEDDRQAKKYGYGGLALADFLRNPSSFVCLGTLILGLLGLGFIGGIRMMIPKQSR